MHTKLSIVCVHTKCLHILKLVLLLREKSELARLESRIMTSHLKLCIQVRKWQSVCGRYTRQNGTTG